MNEGNGKDLYKLLTSFLLGVVITGITAYFVSQKDMITRREFTEYQVRVDKRADATDQQIEKLTDATTLNAMAIRTLTEDMKLVPHPTK